MSAPLVLYHCPCSSPTAPPPQLPSSAYAFHELHTLYFCEECDAIRCNRCVSVEASGYYCPNCLFEVPSATVRADRNRCARNCFVCPHCCNTLSVVSSDPANPSGSTAAVGEPPYFLYCNFCRWDSADVGITFDKPTGISAQMQKYEDNAPDFIEFERLKDHLEPFLRINQLRSSTMYPASTSHNPITAAASSALQREIPGLRVSRIGNPSDKAFKEDLAPFTPLEARRADHSEDVDWLRTLTDVGEISSISQRYGSTWDDSIRARDLKPLRMPLQSKKSKRCPSCRHILIKPEQKAQSVRYKIKLVATNYLPAMDVSTPEDASSSSRRRTISGNVSALVTTSDDPTRMQAGRTYHFQLAFTNPLYDPITVRLALQQPPQRPNAAVRRPPFMVTVPTTTIPVAAFAEAWEYEDDDAAIEEDIMAGRMGSAKEERGKWKIGVVEKRANTTKVGGEIVLGKDVDGEIKFNLLVTYTYKSDETHTDDKPSKSPAPASELKSFAFWTVVHLGVASPKAQQ